MSDDHSFYEKALAEYHQFVGSFLSQYANVEALLRYLLRLHCRLNEEEYQILIGLPRTRDLIDKTQKIALLTAEDEAAKAIKDAFAQLDIITAIRDQIVHYGGYPLVGGEVLVRLKPGHKSATTKQAYEVYDPAVLFAAGSDLYLIHNMLSYRLDTSLEGELQRLVEFSGVRKQPWRYTPPARLQNQTQRPESGPKRPRQPRPSGQ